MASRRPPRLTRDIQRRYALKQQGYTRTEIQREVDRDDFLRNNKCAVVGKALQTWDSYQSLKEWWETQDDPAGGKPTPPSTDKNDAYPLVMAHTEDYRLTVDDDTNCVQVRTSPKPYKKVKVHLRGEPDAMDELLENKKGTLVAMMEWTASVFN